MEDVEPWGAFLPKFSEPLAAKLCVRFEKSFRSAKMVQNISVTMRSMVRLEFRAPLGVEKV